MKSPRDITEGEAEGVRVALLRMGGCGRRNVPVEPFAEMGKAGTCVGGKGTPFFAEKGPGRVKKHFFRLSPGCRGGGPALSPLLSNGAHSVYAGGETGRSPPGRSGINPTVRRYL